MSGLLNFHSLFSTAYLQVAPKISIRKQQTSYDWLLQKHKHAFYPDYFQVSFIGQSLGARVYNRLSTNVGGPLSISRRVLSRIVHLFYEVYETNGVFLSMKIPH